MKAVIDNDNIKNIVASGALYTIPTRDGIRRSSPPLLRTASNNTLEIRNCVLPADRLRSIHAGAICRSASRNRPSRASDQRQQQTLRPRSKPDILFRGHEDGDGEALHRVLGLERGGDLRRLRSTKPSDSPSRLALAPESAAERQQRFEDQAWRAELRRREATKKAALTYTQADRRQGSLPQVWL